MDMPKASVTILVWNGIEYLDACLGAVLAQEYDRFQVIVVDNGSTDGSAELVASHFPQVKLIRLGRNLGYAAGNNVGLQAAEGDILVLLNQDTRVHPGWLASLALTLEDPGVGIAGCRLLYPDGSVQHAGGYLCGPRGETGHRGRTGCVEVTGLPVDNGTQGPTDVEFVTGAALAIRRETLGTIGLLDQEFWPAYYEDVDWCFRARASGYRVVYQPEAILTHYESTTTGPLSRERKLALNQGRLRFLFKHWTLEKLNDEFGPAELAWLASMERSEELMAARRAYLKTMLALPGILAFRESTLAEAETMMQLLNDLRLAAVQGLSTRQSREGERASLIEGNPQLQALLENQMLHEHTFTSQVPVLGPVIVAVRNLWNSVATKWYVRPLVRQQSALNAQMVRYLEGLTRDVAENVDELTAIAAQLAALDARFSDLHSRAEED